MIYEADKYPDQRIAKYWKGGSYACFELLVSDIVDYYFLVPTGYLPRFAM
jgi:hypothetical protein